MNRNITFFYIILISFCCNSLSSQGQDCITLQKQVASQKNEILKLIERNRLLDIEISKTKKRETDVQLKYELCKGEGILIKKEVNRLELKIESLTNQIAELKKRIKILEQDSKQLANQIIAKDSLIESEERLIAYYKDQDTLNSYTIKNLEWQNAMRSLELHSVVLENYKNQKGYLFIRFNLSSRIDIGIQPLDSVLIKITLIKNVDVFKKEKDIIAERADTNLITIGASGSGNAIAEQFVYLHDLDQRLNFVLTQPDLYTRRKIKNNKYSLQVYCIIKDRQTLIGTKYITWENIVHH